jgi:hypothetical protein
MSSNETAANPFAVGEVQKEGSSSAEAMVTSKAAQEVQAAMVIAKKFPRNENEAFARIMKSCNRKSLAEVAIYSFPRGGTAVSGASIRLAEAMAQGWGNLDVGVIELENRGGASQVMAYCWDLETNTRVTKVFQVRHERSTRGGVKVLDDPRDIYEMVANQGARRLRACILAVIPGDVQDAAVAACNQTLLGDGTTPISDQVRAMASAFENEISVTVEMLEDRLGHTLASTTASELVQLRKIFASVRDNMSKQSDWFGREGDVGSAAPPKPKTPLPAEKGTNTPKRTRGKNKSTLDKEAAAKAAAEIADAPDEEPTGNVDTETFGDDEDQIEGAEVPPIEIETEAPAEEEAEIEAEEPAPAPDGDFPQVVLDLTAACVEQGVTEEQLCAWAQTRLRMPDTVTTIMAFHDVAPGKVAMVLNKIADLAIEMKK